MAVVASDKHAITGRYAAEQIQHIKITHTDTAMRKRLTPSARYPGSGDNREFRTFLMAKDTSSGGQSAVFPNRGDPGPPLNITLQPANFSSQLFFVTGPPSHGCKGQCSQHCTSPLWGKTTPLWMSWSRHCSSIKRRIFLPLRHRPGRQTSRLTLSSSLSHEAIVPPGRDQRKVGAAVTG